MVSIKVEQVEALIEPQMEEEGGDSQTVRPPKHKEEKGSRLTRPVLKAATISASSKEESPELTFSGEKNPKVTIPFVSKN